MKTIKQICEYFNIECSSTDIISNIQNDSRHVNENSLFIAIEKGNLYVDDALKNGAKFVISDIDVLDLKKRLMEFCLWFYEYPTLDIDIIGITGTNGKSTTAFYLHQLLKKSLLISNIYKGKREYFVNNTTPSPIEIVHALLYAKNHKLKFIIMEVSSIGIKEYRVEGLLFNAIGLTNIESDHLDYHQTLENYQMSKIDFINDQVSLVFISSLDKQLLSLINRPYVLANKVKLPNIKRISDYNKKNLSLAASIANNYIKVKKHHLRRLRLPKGRGQVICYKPRIIIDYAHTESAFFNILNFEKSITKGRLLVIFGSGGNRDKTKRNKYGNLVKRFSDFSIVTNDNPRDENPLAIVSDIIKGNEDFFEVELDRKKAIKKIILMANKLDTILILGKGHETIQLVNDMKIYLSDEEEARKWKTRHLF